MSQLTLFAVCKCGCGAPIKNARWPSWQREFVHGHNGSHAPILPEWDDVEIAWAAGLFEGEGCISVHKCEGRRPMPKVSMNLTDYEPLNKFVDIIGIGNITGPYPRPKWEPGKPRWSWQVAGKGAVAILRRPGFVEQLGPRRQRKALEVLDACT